MIQGAGTTWARLAAWIALVLILGAAVVLGIVGVDLIRTPGEMSSDDRRFQTAPARQAGLWDVGLLPGDLDEQLLGLEDDVAYRQLVGSYLRVEPGKVDAGSTPELESLRAKTQFDLTEMSQKDPSPTRRSHLLTLYGVMRLDTSFISPEERTSILRDAASAFRNAITLDPENADAKTNLEAVLSVHGPIVFPPNAASQGTAKGKVSGQGRPGSGY